jgi:hypothetical protein
MEARVKQPFEIAKLKAAQAIQDGDPAAAGHLLVSGIVASSQIISARKPEFATKAFQAAAAEAKATGTTWNSQKAEADYNVAKSPAMATFFGSANSLLDKGGTLDQLLAQHAKLGHGKDSIPVFNKLEDYANYASGKPALAGFIQTALGASDDYAKVMGGGQGSDSARLELMKSFTHAHNNGQMQAAVDAAKAAVGSQTSARVGRNPVLKQMYGQDGGSASAPAAPQGQPVFVGGKLVGHSTDGKTMIPVGQ